MQALRAYRRMTCQLWIPGRLPGLNEIVESAKGFGGRGFGYSKLKRQHTERMTLLARAAKVKRFDVPVVLTFKWVEPNRRRDRDNVAAAKKLILDALVKAGVIASDGWHHVIGWTDTFAVDPAKPGVLVTLAPA